MKRKKQKQQYRLEFEITSCKPVIKLLQGKVQVCKVISITEWKSIATCSFHVDENSSGWQAEIVGKGIPIELEDVVTNFIRSYYNGMMLQDNCIVWADESKSLLFQVQVV